MTKTKQDPAGQAVASQYHLDMQNGLTTRKDTQAETVNDLNSARACIRELAEALEMFIAPDPKNVFESIGQMSEMGKRSWASRTLTRHAEQIAKARA